MKTPTLPRKKILACMTAVIFSLNAAEAGATTFEQNPILGIGSSYPPNVLLALSVEFPTAGAAYKQDNSSNYDPENYIRLTESDFKQNTYLGYFDPDKCYNYNDARGYFEPVGKAPADRYCGNSNTFSGNALNWMSMTTIDIFRSVMTGGNRAAGKDNTLEVYQNGDEVGRTVLRRAFVGISQNAAYGMYVRAIDGNLARNVLPSAVTQNISSSDKLLVRNDGFQMAFGYVKNAVEDEPGVNYHYPRDNPKVAGKSYRYYKQELPLFDNNTRAYNVQVEVCRAGMPESNCRAYSANNLKPEGLMQEYLKKMRFSVFGYLNDTSVMSGSTINGGVMRARMKSLLGERTADGIQLGEEINGKTGQFEINPDKQDASASGVGNSGVINYLNKFGDSGRYRGSDPAAELYYAGLRYFRNQGNLPDYLKAVKTGNADADNQAKDNFPVIENWNDPLLSYGETEASKAAVCRPNFLLYIGDTFTHHDNDIPNAYKPGGKNLPEAFTPGDADVETEKYLQMAARAESSLILTGGNGRKTFGAGNGTPKDSSDTAIVPGHSYGGIIGLAYWARTNDIRKNMGGNQTIRTIMVDVVEKENYRSEGGDWNDNQFYWAAKYGGFDDKENESKGLLPVLKPVTDPSSRAQWTSDAEGQTSIPKFKEGVPNNYGAANNPDKLREVLKKSFANIGAKSDTPSQAPLGLDLNESGVLDVSNNSLIMQSSYKQNEHGWQGDVIAYRSSAIFGNLNTNPPSPAWKLSDRFAAYRNGWGSRNVWARSSDGTVRQFSRANAVAFASSLALDKQNRDIDRPENLIEYMLGSNANEDGLSGNVYRKRPDNGLLGTVVNSSVAIIKAPKSTTVNTCRYADSNITASQKTLYAFAANDGMLHIADNNGSEQFAYMPADALPKLKTFAAAGASHTYINDGSPVAAEVCMTSGAKNAKTVVVGTTGRGGNSVYALDVTNMITGNTATSGDSSNVLWEFNASDDAGLGLTVHKPVITSLKLNGENAPVPVAVVSSGYNAADGGGYIYVFRLDKSGAWLPNNNYWKIKLDKTGVGMPKVVDTDNDGALDRIYVGDESGKMWRIDHTNGTFQTAKKLFEGSDKQPITGAPDVFNNAGNYTVVFSTGRYFDPTTDASKADVQNYAYGLFDKDGSTIGVQDLLQQTADTVSATQNSAGNNKVYYRTSHNTLSPNHKGWRFEMPKGFISVADALVRRERTAQFTAFKTADNNGTVAQSATGNVCTADSGESATIEIDARTGAMYRERIFDTDNDRSFTQADMPAGMVVNKGQTALFASVATVTINGKRYDAALRVGDDGKFTVELLNRFTKGVRRISWREIF